MSKFNYQQNNCTDDIDDRLTQAYLELEVLTNSIPGGVAKVLLNGDYISMEYASDGFYNLGGYPKNEFIDLVNRNELFKIINTEDYPNLINSIKEQLKLKNPFIPEFRIVKKDSTIAWIMT